MINEPLKYYYYFYMINAKFQQKKYVIRHGIYPTLLYQNDFLLGFLSVKRNNFETINIRFHKKYRRKYYFFGGGAKYTMSFFAYLVQKQQR